MRGDPSPILTEALLDELEKRWAAQRAPLVEFLRPGLDDDEMTATVAPLGLTVPVEARTWWRWHDGVAPDRRPLDQQMTGLGWQFFSLARAVREATTQRDRAREVAGDRADPLLWRWAWLPVADNYHGGVIAVDGTRPAAEEPRTEIFYAEPEVGAKHARPRARSFGEMVTWWIEAMDDHLIDYDAVVGRWRYESERIDPRLERSRLV